MNMTKTIFATAAIACFSLSASAMQPLAEEQLSEVTGQAISILANLDVNIPEVTYTDNGAGAGGSVTFSDINVTGLAAASIDILTAVNFQTELTVLLGAATPAVLTAAVTTGFYDGSSDVVKISVPNLGIADGDALLLDVNIGDIRMGATVDTAGTHVANVGGSWGGLSLDNINLQGTTVYIWAH